MEHDPVTDMRLIPHIDTNPKQPPIQTNNKEPSYHREDALKFDVDVHVNLVGVADYKDYY